MLLPLSFLPLSSAPGLAQQKSKNERLLVECRNNGIPVSFPLADQTGCRSWLIKLDSELQEVVDPRKEIKKATNLIFLKENFLSYYYFPLP